MSKSDFAMNLMNGWNCAQWKDFKWWWWRRSRNQATYYIFINLQNGGTPVKLWRAYNLFSLFMVFRESNREKKTINLKWQKKSLKIFSLTLKRCYCLLILICAFHCVQLLTFHTWTHYGLAFWAVKNHTFYFSI